MVVVVNTTLCPPSAPFFGFMGIVACLVFCNLGAAYGTSKSGVGMASMGVFKPGLVMRCILPLIMAGILGIYGLIVSMIMFSKVSAKIPLYDTTLMSGKPQYSSFLGFAHLAAGLCCGLSSLAAGITIGIVGDAGVRAVGQQERLFVSLILMMIFAEAIALYGLIISIVMVGVDVDAGVCLMTQ